MCPPSALLCWRRKVCRGRTLPRNIPGITGAMAAAKPAIVFLSGHYYAEGPPADPRMTLEFLLKRGRNPETEEFAVVLAKRLKTLGKGYQHDGRQLVLPWRQAAGQRYASASALWAGDYLLQLAQEGYLGAKSSTGGGNGLVHAHRWGHRQPASSARPACYGMLLAERFAGSTFVQATLSKQTDAAQNVTAFAKCATGKRTG